MPANSIGLPLASVPFVAGISASAGVVDVIVPAASVGKTCRRLPDPSETKPAPSTVRLPLRVNSVWPVTTFFVVKNPSPLMARSSAEPVCSIGPNAKFWLIDSTAAPIPTTSLGLVKALPTTMSANSVRLFLKPVVSALAILWLITPRSVWAFFNPLSDV